jgi:hypothetical protein
MPCVADGGNLDTAGGMSDRPMRSVFCDSHVHVRPCAFPESRYVSDPSRRPEQHRICLLALVRLCTLGHLTELCVQHLRLLSIRLLLVFELIALQLYLPRYVPCAPDLLAVSEDGPD